MKKNKSFLLIAFLAGIMLTGCLSDPDFSVRVENNFVLDFVEFEVGTQKFGEIPSGEITDYLPIDEGKHTVKGSFIEDEDSELSEMELGSFSVEARTGSHKYTIEVTSEGNLELNKDE